MPNGHHPGAPTDAAMEIAPAGGQLTITIAPRTLRMHQVSDSELDEIGSSGASIHFGFLGISVGALISFAIVLNTTPISDPRTYAAYVALCGLSGILTAYFGIRSVAEHQKGRRRLRTIKGEAS